MPQAIFASGVYKLFTSFDSVAAGVLGTPRGVSAYKKPHKMKTGLHRSPVFFLMRNPTIEAMAYRL